MRLVWCETRVANWLLSDLPAGLRKQAEEKLRVKTHVIADERPTSVQGNGGPKKSKFGNKKTEVNGIVFHSKREAARYVVLAARELAGEIKDLQRQVRYQINVNGIRICDYIADFVYLEGDKKVVEDSKGYPNDRWPMKKKLMKAVHGVEILET